MLQKHPDKNNNSPSSTEIAQVINNAREACLMHAQIVEQEQEAMAAAAAEQEAQRARAAAAEQAREVEKKARKRAAYRRKRALLAVCKILNDTAGLATQAVKRRIFASGSMALQLSQKITQNINAALAIKLQRLVLLKKLVDIMMLLTETIDLAKHPENVLGQQITKKLEDAKAIVATATAQ